MTWTWTTRTGECDDERRKGGVRGADVSNKRGAGGGGGGGHPNAPTHSQSKQKKAGGEGGRRGEREGGDFF